MNKKVGIFALSEAGAKIGHQIRARVGGELIGLEGRVTDCDFQVVSIGDAIREAYTSGRPVIAVMASGALIRILAPLLKDKRNEPPVIAVSEDGKSVVPLLGGHHGANDLTRMIAANLNGHAAITTAGDLRFGVALDQPPAGWTLANPENAKAVMASLLAGASVCRTGDAADMADWLDESGLDFAADGKICLHLTTAPHAAISGPSTLVFVPRVCMLGIGCERGCDSDEVISLVEAALQSAKLSPLSIGAIGSIDLKADESAIHAAGMHFDVPVLFFTAKQLEEETDRLVSPSEIVFAEVGCHGVAEGAALALAGADGKLIVPKQKSKRATVALARVSKGFEMNEKIAARKRGRLFVVGIGPGQEGWRSPEVSRMIGEATDLVGYSLYLDLISAISGGKVRHDFDLGKEEDRVRHAMELAGTGKDVALVCSGDAGIYAMATLVFELLQNGGLSDAAQRIEIAVSPGISALQAAAARAGAPLGHDFCTISLSDLLTPWEAIQMRVKAAAEGDFVIAFYNPVSRRRRTQLAYARDVLLQHRPADTPVILATDLGRTAEKVRIVPLAELDIDDVDMLTVVVVGSSETRTVKTGDGKTWVYTPRGYAAKEGTRIGAEKGAAS